MTVDQQSGNQDLKIYKNPILDHNKETTMEKGRITPM